MAPTSTCCNEVREDRGAGVGVLQVERRLYQPGAHHELGVLIAEARATGSSFPVALFYLSRLSSSGALRQEPKSS